MRNLSRDDDAGGHAGGLTDARDDGLVPGALQAAEGALSDYGVFLVDPRGRVLTWNAGAERIHGWTASEVVGRDLRIFCCSSDLDVDAAGEQLARAAATGRCQVETRRRRRDGSEFPARLVITRAVDAAGVVTGLLLVVEDLTERRRAEEAHRSIEQRFRLLVDSVRDYAIFLLDRDGIVTTWNAGAERLKGYEADEIIGQHFSRFYPEEDVAAGKCAWELEEAATTGRFEDEGWRVRRDGTRFWANVVITAVRDARGEVVAFAKVTRDLTERRRDEERLRRAYDGLEKRVQERTRALAAANAKLVEREGELAHALRERDDFLIVAAHELRTPITALKLQLEDVRRRAARQGPGALDRERLAKALDVASRGADNLARLVDTLLDAQAARADRLVLHRTPVDLERLVRDAVARHAAALAAARCDVTIDTPGAVLATVDPVRVGQVVDALLSNAVKYAPRAPITVRLSASPGTVRLEIADRGPGIAASAHAAIFERFGRATDSRRVSGLGIGLWVARRIVEAHGGTLELDSTPPEGARFVATFPHLAVAPPV